MTDQEWEHLPTTPDPGGQGSDSRYREWSPTDGLIALALALGFTFGAGVILIALLTIAGVSDPTEGPSIALPATLLQQAAFAGSALFIASQSGHLSAARFGLTGFKLSAVGLSVAALIAYYAFTFLYALIFEPPKDDLPKSLGIEGSTALAVIAGVLIIGIAPFVEELFFRGFLYKALKNGIGVWPGALASGAVFGLVHLKPAFFVPLAVLGVILALLYQRTGSIWPCIAVHAANNAIAFAVTV